MPRRYVVDRGANSFDGIHQSDNPKEIKEYLISNGQCTEATPVFTYYQEEGFKAQKKLERLRGVSPPDFSCN